MKMNKYECHCSDTDCILQSNKRPTFCPYYSHISPDWRLIVDEVPNLGNADSTVPNLGNLPNWITEGISNEYRWAVEKHPNFPSNEFEMMCVIQEELGEAIQALNDLKHHQQGVINDVNIELLHTIVTCLRTLMAINEKEKF